MPRGRGQGAGHNHVLAAIAEAIHSANTWKGQGKGSKGKGGKGGGGGGQSGRNCAQCGDYNFEHRHICRRCGASLPPPTWNGWNSSSATGDGKAVGKGAWNTWGKGGGGQKANGGDGGGTGKGDGAEGTAQAPPAAVHAACKEDAADATKDPTGRVKEIRLEEDRLKKTRAQLVDVNPRMLVFIDSELAKLSSERERLQPLEINLQAAAGRTANARAGLAKAKERKEAAAKELRSKLEAFRNAEKEVKEAEEKLRATEAAATARRSEAKLHDVQDAVDFLQQAAADKVDDKAAASEVAAALQKIAQMLNGLGARSGDSGGGGGGADTVQTSGATAAEGGAPTERGFGHPVMAVCGATPGKKLLLAGPPPQHPAAHSGGGAADDIGHQPGGKGSGSATGPTSGAEQDLYAGGAVDGEIVMGQAGKNGRDDANDEDVAAQATAALADDSADL